MGKKQALKNKPTDSVSHTDEIPSIPLVQRKPLFFNTLMRSFLVGIGMLIIIIFLAALTVSFAYVSKVSSASGLRTSQILSLAYSGLTHPVTLSNGRINILVLGLDEDNLRDNSVNNTDTIMVISINVKNGNIITFSFPRDLYIPEFKSKINGLYDIQSKKDPTHASALIKSQVEKLSGISIQHVLLIPVSELKQLIDAVGGIDVSVQRAFTDYLYPIEGRERMDCTTQAATSSNEPLALSSLLVSGKIKRSDLFGLAAQYPCRYQYVHFDVGTIHLNGEQALTYVRSRHSLDPIEGTDDARVRRQQQVISILIKKMENPALIKQPQYIGKLLGLYIQDFNRYVSLSDVIAIGKQFLVHHLTPEFVSHQFTIQQDGQKGILYHPSDALYGTWVYLPVDPTWNQLTTTVQSWLK